MPKLAVLGVNFRANFSKFCVERKAVIMRKYAAQDGQSQSHKASDKLREELEAVDEKERLLLEKTDVFDDFHAMCADPQRLMSWELERVLSSRQNEASPSLGRGGSNQYSPSPSPSIARKLSIRIMSSMHTAISAQSFRAKDKASIRYSSSPSVPHQGSRPASFLHVSQNMKIPAEEKEV